VLDCQRKAGEVGPATRLSTKIAGGQALVETRTNPKILAGRSSSDLQGVVEESLHHLF